MKILLVDDEDQVLRGVSRMIESEMDEWEVDTALSGPEALEILDEESFNVIVSDMRMPGMDGAELLENVEKSHPDVVRIVLSGQADAETVMRAVRPMHKYLSKPCNPNALIEMIRRAEVFQETITSPDVLNAIGKADCLPSLPTLVDQVTRELENEECTAKSLANIIMRDPTLCARVLQVANSAIFGLAKPVTNIDQGVSIVGGDIIRSLVLSLELFPENDAKYKSICPKALFTHCFQVAVIARQLAESENIGGEHLNTVFSAGLLHDIGKLILMKAFPEQYSKVLSKDNSDTEFWKLELEEFGASHQGIGAYLLELWDVPHDLIDAVAAHHSFDSCVKGSPVSQLVYGANLIAHGASTDDLRPLVESCKDTTKAEQLLLRLKRWQEHYNNNQTKGA